ncbi:MAG: multicopper oxidase domain-containing protein [Flavobacteriales bacterium]|nr:multicopper oxidase domain-containing protein [Flavobacteriales bacterium]
MGFLRFLRITIHLVALLLLLLSGGLATAQDGYGTRALGTSVPGGDFTPRINRYELTVRDTIVNYTGKARMAFTVNGQMPMPTLTFTEGDTAEIVVHNAMEKEETSLHWHGIILPNQLDGVPYLTTAPIKAGETQVYKFPLLQSGTYWYHSHTKLQEQNGMHGALIIHKRRAEPMREHVLILSEWTDMKPFEVHRRLHSANDWSAIKKHRIRPGSVQSYSDAIKEGAFGIKLTNEWKRMNAMDVSDVYYDLLFANGKPVDQAGQFKAGERVRVRIINGGASSYFWITYAGGKMKVVASDGIDVEPVEVDRFIMGIAETYDIIVTIPADSTAYELLATTEDRVRSTSLWLGNGIRQLAAPLQPLKYFAGMKMMNDMMKMNGDLDDMGMNMSLQQMDMNVVMYPEITGAKDATPVEGTGHSHGGDAYNSNALSDIVTLNYAMLRSPTSTALPPGPVKEMRFELTGNMNRYLWAIDNKTVSETDRILIHKGENVRIIMYNNSMMRHPMHLHGHFFRVVNGQGDHAPLKNVLDIMPMETDTIEFAATETGDWFFHCHILYHMMSGMGRVFSYENTPPNPQLPDARKAARRFARDDKEWHFMVQNDFATNGNDGEAMYMNKRWNLQSEWRLGYTKEHGQEVETHFGRYFGKMQWLFVNVGLDWRTRDGHGGSDPDDNLFGQRNTKNSRTVAHIGFQYTLPMLLVLDMRIDTDGQLRSQLMREDIPLTPRLRLDLMGNTDLEYMAGLRYVLDKTWAARAHYDSDMGWGVGAAMTY